MKTYFLQMRADNTITDAIEYEHEGYMPFQTNEPLPIGINGGWWKLVNGELVEVSELKPIDEKTEIEQLKQENQQLRQSQAEQDLLIMQLMLGGM